MRRRYWLRRFAFYAFLLALAFASARAFFRDIVLALPVFRDIEATGIGRLIGQVIDAIAAAAFGVYNNAALSPDMVAWIDAMRRQWDYIVEQILSIRLAQVIAPAAGALSVALIGVFHTLWTNRKIQRMCSGQLYVTALKLILNHANLAKAFTKKEVEGGVQVTLHVDDDVRAAMHRLRSELELIQDFSVAYDYAFWPKLRRTTAAVRMRAMSVREAIDVVMSEMDRMQTPEGDINMSTERYYAVVVHSGYDRVTLLPFTNGIAMIIPEILMLGEKLEVGRILQWFGVRGSAHSLPEGLENLKALVKGWLKQARKEVRENRIIWWSGKRVSWAMGKFGRPQLQLLAG